MIEVKQTHGVGMRATYVVFRDGKPVATISRFSARTGWKITSIHYGHHLGGGSNIDDAREAAQSIYYPDPHVLYEEICQNVENHRRISLEAIHTRDFVRLSREIIAGSNSARAELEQLIHNIDAEARDRSDTGPIWNRTEGYTWQHGHGYFPLPPDANGKTQHWYLSSGKLRGDDPVEG